MRASLRAWSTSVGCFTNGRRARTSISPCAAMMRAAFSGDVVMRWTTGYPFGVNLCRGYPRFNPGEYSTVDLLLRGDNDAALILGADPGATMPQPVARRLRFGARARTATGGETWSPGSCLNGSRRQP